MRKQIALFLSFIMLLSTAVPAYAAEDPSDAPSDTGIYNTVNENGTSGDEESSGDQDDTFSEGSQDSASGEGETSGDQDDTGSETGSEGSQDGTTGEGEATGTQDDTASEAGSEGSQDGASGDEEISGAQDDTGSETGSEGSQGGASGDEEISGTQDDTGSETGSEGSQDSATGEGEQGIVLSSDAQAFSDWVYSISWDAVAAYDALERYEDLTAEELAGLEEIMGYLYGLQTEYNNTYAAIFAALSDEEQAALTEAYDAYVSVEECIAEYENVAYQTAVISSLPTDIAETPVKSGSVGSSTSGITYAVHANLDDNGSETGTYTMIFSGTGAAYANWMSSNPAWYTYKTTITRVYIGEGITSIHPYTFSDMSKLSTIITDSPSLKVVDNVLFNADMTELVKYPAAKEDPEYTVPNTVTSIQPAAFYNNDNLQIVNLPDTVTTISDRVFTSCGNLETVNLASSYVTAIGQYAFYGCTPFSVDISTFTSLETIGYQAFGSCNGITKLHFPASLKSMGTEAFKSCANLTTVTFEENDKLTQLGSSAFSQCRSLVDVDLTTLPALTQMSYSFSYCSGLKEIVIPDTVTILNGTFSYCTALNKVVFEENSALKTVSYAFSSTQSLPEIILPNTVEEIGGSCFESSGITSINWEDLTNLKTIGNYAFRYSKITSIDIPDTVTSIGNFAFYSCSNATEAIVPASVTSIGDRAFSASGNLISISVDPENVGYCDVEGILFTKDLSELLYYPGGKTEYTEYTVADGTVLHQEAFSSNRYLGVVNLPSDLTTIPFGLFRNATALNYTNIDELENLTVIDGWSFAYCTNLDYFVIPEGVSLVGENATWGATFNTAYILGIDPSALTIQNNGLLGVEYKGTIYVATEEMKSVLTSKSYNTVKNITIEVGYTITVPASLSVDADAGKIKLDGVATEDLVFSIIDGKKVTMTDAVGNELPALIDYDTITFRWGKHERTIAVKWPEDGTPAIGTWSGNIIYSEVPVKSQEEG